MVKFQIASDLHIERDTVTPSAASLLTPSANVLILAGDVGHVYKYEQLKSFLTDVCEKFEIVLYVLGNHEYYRERDVPEKTMDEVLHIMKNLCNQIPNLYLLDRSSVVIDDVCIIGCTLWSQSLTYVPPYIVRINGMNSRKYNEMHARDLKYIKKMIRYCRKKNLKLLVVTHHCPTYLVTRNKSKKKDKFISLYASNLDLLLDSDKVHTWICGHIHNNFDFITDKGTRLVSNQRGKPKDKIRDFLPNKVIQV
jgi:Icc-related predicted phosphoesterase